MVDRHPQPVQRRVLRMREQHGTRHDRGNAEARCRRTDRVALLPGPQFGVHPARPRELYQAFEQRHIAREDQQPVTVGGELGRNGG